MRYLGLDVGKRYVQACLLNEEDRGYFIASESYIQLNPLNYNAFRDCLSEYTY